MKSLQVSKEKCIGCGMCVESCPFQLIAMDNKEEVPYPKENFESICIDCGHCATVCPKGAITLSGQEAEAFEALQKDLMPEFNQVDQLMRSRRSIRIYKDKNVERNLLEEVITTAQYAPTGHNTQLVKTIVIDNKEEINRLASMIVDWMRFLIDEKSPDVEQFNLIEMVETWDSGEADMIFRGAPVLVINHAPKAYSGADLDCGINLTYVELAAWSKGIGSCWAGVVRLAMEAWPPFKEALNIPVEDTCQAMMLGYPKYKYQRIPVRNSDRTEWR